MFLIEFYKSYAEWLIKGAPNNMPYERHSGLCRALDTFCMRRGMDTLDRYRLGDQQKKLFVDAGLNESFPFHNGDLNQYHYETILGTCHQNVQRVNWVHAHAN
ncbi:hypothetical protein Ea92_07 [Erwinia phage Ea9-2]|uniref:Uncharacterized protein n=1 Tax=Erwinia phage Ea9-2 TaxID=1429767 RepID=W6B0Y5_9CAUD|nr:hypothetical protein Ea92_07 [Erwinia phage Ea9-2]AHI60064.1 hypothetical protein Ea92_07 [Erwinia phage Ea9-2]